MPKYTNDSTAEDKTYEGIVSAIKLDRGFGFISAPGLTLSSPTEAIEFPDCYFNKAALHGLEFDDKLIYRRVQFEMRSGKGNDRPKAINVRAMET
jgi:cold shock CspA family protein